MCDCLYNTVSRSYCVVFAAGLRLGWFRVLQLHKCMCTLRLAPLVVSMVFDTYDFLKQLPEVSPFFLKM